MAPMTAKRAKVAHSPSTQSNLRDLFAKQSTSPIKRIDTKSQEDQELEWAIQASLQESHCAPLLTTAAVASTPLALAEKSTTHVQVKRAPTPPSPLASSSPTYDTNLTIKDQDDQETCKFFSSTGNLEAGDDLASDPTSAKGKQFNAFSRLMSSHSEAKEWAAVDATESRNAQTRFRQRRSAPFYKILTGMPICVDGFRFGTITGCKAYFLSHFHADHYGGITSSWEGGPIYCSQTTANLVRTSLHVQEHLICPLPFNIPTTVPGTGGVRVTLLDANHCPGSSLFLFEGPQTCHILPPPPGSTRPAVPPPSITFRYLHCGDFRASPRHVNHPLIKGKRLDIIYLDTTYCNPRYCFPAQEMVIKACADMVRRAAPEQCKMAPVKMDEEEPDWRIGPLRGKKLKEAMEAELNRPSVDAMKGWLESGSAVKREMLVKEEDDLGDLEFKDEEVDFKGDDQMGEVDEMEVDETQIVIEGEDDALQVEDAIPDQPVVVKPEYDDEETLLFEEDPQSGLGAELKEEEGNLMGRNESNSTTSEDVPSSTIYVPECEADYTSHVKKEEEVSAEVNPPSKQILVVVGTYTIGKEKIVIACAKALRTRVYCADPRKYNVYAQLEDDELHSLLTRDPLKAHVHVTSLMTINGEALREHTSKMRSLGMRIDRAIAFRPTGWTYQPPAGADLVSPSLDRVIAWNQGRQFSWLNFHPTRDSTKEFSIYGVPYSEHSSFFELSAFALSVEWVRIIATVNVGNPTSRAKMARWFEKWKAERKRRNFKAVESRTEDYF